MSDQTMVKMTVKFIDGSMERYSFKRQLTEEDPYTMLKKIQEALDVKHLVIDLGSKVQIIPVNNILQIELEPPPKKFPSTCIRDASLI